MSAVQAVSAVPMTDAEMQHKLRLVFAADRLIGRCVVTETGCVEWTGCLNSRGYGVISLAGRRVLTHRMSYELHIGPIPEGLTIDHLCRNKKCIHPDHLEAVTDNENKRRASVARTTCIHGHELTAENTIVKKRRDGRTLRNCRTCTNRQQRDRRAS